MAIDPQTTITVKVGDLGSAAFNTTDLVPHEVDGYLKNGTLQDLATFIGSIIDVNGAIGFRAVQISDGQTLPATTQEEFILVGPGTYPNVGGGGTITTTGSLNALVSNGVFWFIGVEIPITVNGIWGDIDGVISDQTDLWDILVAKADLVDGKVPNSQLPSYVDDVIEVANYAALPVSGETGKIYVTVDTGFVYRWSGSAYIRIANEATAWGTIVGTLGEQTDLQTALNLKVPYTGATGNVNLGEFGLTAGFLGLDITPTSTPTGVGTIYWDAANRTAALIDGDGDTTLQIGQEQRVLVRNNTGVTLTDGQIVYITGSTGDVPNVALASASSETTSSTTLGMVTESIANGSDGFITISGKVNGLNTLAFNEGDLLWLGTTAGTFTATKPTSPNHLVLIGYVIKKSGGNGSVLVKIQNTQELSESSDVLFSGLANNDVLTYESSSSLWKNKSIPTILGYTPQPLLTNPITGSTLLSGNAGDGYLPRASGSTTVTNSLIYDNGQAVFIGASGTATTSKLVVLASGSTYQESLHLQNSSATNSAPVLSIDQIGTGNLIVGNNGSGEVFFVSKNGNVTAPSFIKTGGTSSQFLKADGSIDSNTYATTSQLHDAVTIGTANGLSLSGQVLSLGLASASVNGALSSTDWTTFNNKQNAITNVIDGIVLAGYIPKSTSSTSGLTTLGNSAIYDDSGKIGIGTTSPSGKLTVYGGQVEWGSSSSQGFLGYSGGNALIGSIGAIDFATYTNGTERMRITSGGNLLIGTTTSLGANLVIGGDSNTMRVLPASDNVGYIGESTHRWAAIYAVNGTIQTSDFNDKTNIIESDLGLEYIMKLNPVSYSWKQDDGKKHYGLIAQEVEKVAEFGGLNIDQEKYGLNYSEFIAPLIKALQEQNKMILELKAEIEILKAK